MAKTETKKAGSIDWAALVNGSSEDRQEFKRLWTETYGSEPLMVHYMAFQRYHMVQLQESSNPNYKFGAQYVQVNDVRANIERETPVLVATSVLEALRHAESYGRASDRREDVRIMSQGGPVDCFTAHKKRLSGQVPVVPDRLPEDVKKILEQEL